MGAVGIGPSPRKYVCHPIERQNFLLKTTLRFCGVSTTVRFIINQFSGLK